MLHGIPPPKWRNDRILFAVFAAKKRDSEGLPNPAKSHRGGVCPHLPLKRAVQLRRLSGLSRTRTHSHVRPLLTTVFAKTDNETVSFLILMLVAPSQTQLALVYLLLGVRMHHEDWSRIVMSVMRRLHTKR